MRVTSIFILVVSIILSLPQQASALAERVANWDCKKVDGRNIARNLANGRVTSGEITDGDFGPAKLLVDRIYWEDSPETTVNYIFRLTSSDDAEASEADVIVMDKDPQVMDGVLSANDKFETIHLRRAYKDEWHGFHAQYMLSDDPAEGDLLVSFVTVLECEAVEVSN